MKWILAILLLISYSAIGQSDDADKYIWYKFQYGSRMPRFWSDSVLKAAGLVKFTGLGSESDTSTFKPIAVNSSGDVKKFPHWPGGSGLTDGDKGDIIVSSTGIVWTIAANAVTGTKFRQSAALSVVGNPSNSTDDVIDITASNDHGVLRRFGTSINFGAINLASSNAVTGQLPGANVNITSTQIGYGSGSNDLTSEAALNYNATANKLTADSIRSIKNIPDTVHVGAFESDKIDTAYFFGTSITAGTAAVTNASRYTTLVAGGLRLVEVNGGLGGYLLQKTPTWPLTNTFMDVYTTAIPVKLPGRRYLFFAWGENDATNDFNYSALFGVDTIEFKNDYTTVINYALSLGWALSDIRIISPFYQITSSCPLNIQEEYYNASRNFADSMGIQWIDVFTQGKNYNTLILTDPIHPSNYGHALAADAILKQMTQPLQAQSENVINAGTTLLNQLYYFGKDTAVTGYQLAGFNSNGSMVRVPSERYILLDNDNVARQPGNASVLGHINAGKAIRAMGFPTFTTGSGFEMYYQSGNGFLLPFNRDASTSGNIIMPFSKLLIGNTSPSNPFSQLYVDGGSFGKGLYSSGNPNVIYNTNANQPTLNMLVTADSIGHITTFAPSGYRPLSLNGGSTQPVFINTFTDNSSGAKLQVNGDATVADEAYDATNWNGSLEVPTKNAIRDKIESMGSGGITSINSHTGPAITIQGGTAITVDNSVPDFVTVQVAPSSTALLHPLTEFYTDANNTGTGETDLYTYTAPANTLPVDGQKISFEFAGLLNDATATTDLQVYFGGTAIGGTGAVSVSGTGTWSAKGYIIRASSSTIRAVVTFTIENSTGKIFQSVSSVGSIDFTGANIIKITGTAGGGSGGSNDITAKLGHILFIPIPI